VEISDHDIRHIETLAALHLSDRERDSMRASLQRILEYVATLTAVDVEGVPPTSHVLDSQTVWRVDRVEPSLAVDDALRNAPDTRGPFYRVPRFVGEGDDPT
jgi:aspartyl-tRNA(Asn)/glutamyl-tRNA(Gln) amidotransferase subunit C